MAIYIVGDLHGDWRVLHNIYYHVNSEDTVIQVGDFGIYRRRLLDLSKEFPKGFSCKLYAIDGNHEDFNIINGWSKDEPTEFYTNFFYAPRGYVTTIETQLIAFLGGAESVDKAWRIKSGPDRDWFFEERIQQDDVNRLMKNLNGQSPDVLITHAPPPFVIQANFPPLREQDWGLPLGWVDESSITVSKVFWKTRPKKMYCGHMHKSVLHENIRILDINEIYPHSTKSNDS